MKNEASPFIEAFAHRYGYPLWQYAKVSKAKPKHSIYASEIPEEILEVPVVPNLAEYVNGILQIKLDVEILYKLLEKSAYETYGFEKDPARASPNANDFVKKIMDYENKIWQQNVYQIKDNRLFDFWPANREKPSSFYLRSSITPDGITIIYGYEECWIPNPLSPEGHAPGQDYSWGHTGMCLIWTVIFDDTPIPGWGEGNWDGWAGIGAGNGGTTGIAGWSNSDGSDAAGGSSGASAGPCNPDFKWIRLEVRNSQLYNPCLDQWMEPPLNSGEGNVSTGTSVEPQTGITNDDPDNVWWEDNTTDYPAQNLPSWSNMNANYPKKPDGTEKCAEDVFEEVGGMVAAIGGENACALRMSIALNKSGIDIPNVPGHTFSGADGKYYFLSASKLYNFMLKTFKMPPNPTGSKLSFSSAQGGANGVNFPSLLSGKKGIYLMRPNYPAQFGSQGHASLYNGSSGVANKCDPTHTTDGTYFDNCDGASLIITLWQLN